MEFVLYATLHTYRHSTDHLILDK